MAQELLAATVRLTSAVEALAALAAHARVRTEGLDVDPRIATLLAAVATELIGTADITPADPVPQSVGMARAFLRESLALVDYPDRLGDWSTVDEGVLQGVGRLSMAIAPVLAQVAVDLDGLGEALAVPGSRLLDVGTGTGWLAIALARTFPSTEVTGIDIFAPSLALAARNVAAEHMSHRVTIQERDISTLDEPAEYDAIWLPLPFLPQAVVPKAIERALRALRPGGWVLPGTFAGPGDALSLLLNDLRIVRSGGHPWSGDQMLNMLSNAGFTDCQEKDRTWPAPVRVFAARRPI